MKQISARIERIDRGDEQTLGIMTIYDKHNFPFYMVHTLELPWKNNANRVSCIPVGVYTVIKRWSKKYGNHFHIQDVEGRSYILIHNANYVRQLLGCIAVGNSHTDIDGDGLRDVTASKSTLKKMNKVLPDEFELTIYDKAA